VIPAVFGLRDKRHRRFGGK